MNLTDLDRAKKYEENGYKVELYSMEPYSATPKNNFLIGIKEWNDKVLILSLTWAGLKQDFFVEESYEMTKFVVNKKFNKSRWNNILFYSVYFSG